MQKVESLRATSVSLRIVLVLGILLATTGGPVLAGPADEAMQIASLAGFHGGFVIHVGVRERATDCGAASGRQLCRSGDWRRTRNVSKRRAPPSNRLECTGRCPSCTGAGRNSPT